MKKGTSILIIIVFLFSLLALACAGVGSNVFLITKLDNIDKSQAIMNKGISIFDKEVVKAEKYTLLNEVREYFKVALEYDPANKKAEDYLKKIEDFRIKTYEAKAGAARKFLEKKERSEQENYDLCYNIQKASELDPENPEVAVLKETTRDIRESIITKYIDETTAKREEIVEEEDSAKKEEVYFKLREIIKKALFLDPNHFGANNENNIINGELDKLFQEKVTAFNASMEIGDYGAAEANAKSMREMNDKLEKKYNDQVKDSIYSLYYNWSLEHKEKNELDPAETKINWALVARRTEEGLSLKEEILALKSGGEAGTTASTTTTTTSTTQKDTTINIDKPLATIDGLIADNKLLAAKKEIDALLKKLSDKNQINQVKQREKKITAALPDLYKRAIDFYREEDFKKAIELFEIIVGINPNYEQAADYLEKARSKQEFLESM